MKKRYGHIALLGSNAMWGVMAPVSKGLLAGGVISGTALADIRLLTGTVLFWSVSLFVKTERIEKGDFIKLIGAALFSTALNQMLFVNGVARTSPVDASICTSSLPIWTMFLSVILGTERLSVTKVGGIAIGLCGSLLLVLNSTVRNSEVSSNFIGDIMCIGSQISYAVYLVFFQDIIRKYSATTLMKWKFLFGAMMLLPMSSMAFASVDFSGFSNRDWGALGYILICGTFLSYLIVPVGQKTLKPTVVAMYNYLQPASSALLCIALGMEGFSWIKFIAFVLIFLGVTIVNRQRI